MADGTYGPGAKLPSERNLAEQLGTARTTLRLVLTKLIAEGLIDNQHGSGNYVTEAARPVRDNPAGVEPWRIHGTETIYDNPWVRLELVDVEPPGVERFKHHVVRLRRVAIAAVIDDDDRVLMMWRYRFVPQQSGWELPGGIVEDGEDAVVTAAREVEEETGWRPKSLEHVVSYQPMIGMVDSPHEIYVGRGATRVGEPEEGEEAAVIEWVPLAEIPSLLKRGKLAGSGTLVALLHVLSGGAAT
ncbi:NUDIX domain-containing protein [Catenulispora sp. GP43]|uniref:NUDIX domain-containing protein n=1 Tax=Catenulispora sp. GP43 TaxID=3156263 RepID=UPI003519AADF